MERTKIYKEEVLEQNKCFLATLLENSNSCIVLLSENKDKLGTLAIAVPKPKGLLGSVSSSLLLGDKNAISARMFAEYIAAKKEKIVLVSVYLKKHSETEAQSFFKELIDKILQKNGA